MTKNSKLQFGLIFIGIFLILATYFIYPKLVKKKYQESVVLDERTEIFDEEDESLSKNSFDNVEYKGVYDLEKPFIITSEKAFIEAEDSNIVYMKKMKVLLYMSDGRTVTITSDEGTYNKISHDCYFVDNVKAYDGENNIYADNLDLIASKNKVSAYNNVVLTNNKSYLKADKINYDFETKHYHVSMFNEKKVKLKLVE